MKKRIALLFFVVALVSQSLFARANADGNVRNDTVASQAQAKYVFLFIGDGMSMAHINAAEIFLTARNSRDIRPTPLEFSNFPVTGFARTHDAETFITDSASAGTAIATGHKTLSSVLNMDTGRANRYKTIAEYAKEAGMKVGIVTSVTLNHATPAAFYAKAPSRNDFYDIAVQLANSNFDYFGGGAINQRRGPNNDQRDAVDIAKERGYTYVDTKAGFLALRPGVGKVIAVNETVQDPIRMPFEAGAMPYEIDRKADDLSLADYTRKGIELLYNPNGFFFMVEGGKIDWVGHANDAGTLIHDVLAFEAAVKEAVEFAKRYPNDTLIIVTSDHDTGAMSIGYSGTGYRIFFDKLALQKRSFICFDVEILNPYKNNTNSANAKLEDLLPAIKESFGIDFDSLTPHQKEQLLIAFDHSMGIDVSHGVSLSRDRNILYGPYEPLTIKLTQVLGQTAGIGWTTFAHSGVPAPVFATGARSYLFSGFYDNTDIFRKLAQAMNLRVTN